MKYTYAGDQTRFDPETFIGGNGRFFRPVAATYDSQADTTTVEYERVPLAEMDERYGHLIDKAEDRLRIAEVFGGAP